jgi:hypothetical protein
LTTSKTGDHAVSFQKAFFTALQQEAKGLIETRVVEVFYAQIAADRNIQRILGSASYVIDSGEFLEKISQPRLNQFLNLLAEHQAIVRNFNLEIQINRPKSIHKEKLLGAIEALESREKKVALERLVYKPGLPAPPVEGNSFDIFFWKRRWVMPCRRTSGTLKELGVRSGLVVAAKPVRKVAVVVGGPGVGGIFAGAGTGPGGSRTDTEMRLFSSGSKI